MVRRVSGRAGPGPDVVGAQHAAPLHAGHLRRLCLAAGTRARAPFGGPAVAPVLALPDLDVAVVLGEGLGEDVSAVVAADEVEIGDGGRRGGGGEAGEPGEQIGPAGRPA